MISHWSKTRSKVALSSGEAELNGAVKGISELLGVLGLAIELCDPPRSLTLQTDASACRGMLLRRGAGRVKHLSTKQLWVQGAIEVHNILIKKILRSVNASDLLTHLTTKGEADKFLKMLNHDLVRRS